MQRTHAEAVAKVREILAECKSFCGDVSCRYRGRAICESHFLPADAFRVKWLVVYALERLTNRPDRV